MERYIYYSGHRLLFTKESSKAADRPRPGDRLQHHGCSFKVVGITRMRNSSFNYRGKSAERYAVRTTLDL